MRTGQRGANRQPGGGSVRSGTRPPATGSDPAAVARRRQRGEQRLGVRMLAARRRSLDRRDLDQLAGVQHRDAVAQLGDHAQVVRDQQDGRAACRSRRSREQRQDLGLDRHVERGGRLVGDRAAPGRWPARSRSPRAGCMPPRQPVRRVGVARRRGRDARPRSSSSTARVRASRPLTDRWARIVSATCSPTANAGSSAVSGSWKTMVIRSPRSSRRCCLRAERDAGPRPGSRPGRCTCAAARQQAHDRERQRRSCRSPTRRRRPTISPSLDGRATRRDTADTTSASAVDIDPQAFERRARAAAHRLTPRGSSRRRRPSPTSVEAPGR